MSLELIEVKSSRDLKNFINLPWSLYTPDSPWVPPLKISVKKLLDVRHPFWTSAEGKLFLVAKKNKIVGRILAINNHTSTSFHQDKVGHFGFFDCIEDHQVSALLLDSASNFLRDQGLESMLGPVNPSTNYECGALLDTYDQAPGLLMPYNHPYYHDLFENYGMQKAKDLLSYDIDPTTPLHQRLQKVLDRIQASNRITWKKVTKKTWAQDVQMILEIYNNAWEKNWGFIPMSEDEFYAMTDEMKLILEPEVSIICLVGGDPAGFISALPDINQILKTNPSGRLFPFGLFKLLWNKKSVDRARILTLGIKKKYTSLGLAPLLIQRAREGFMKLGQYKTTELGWVLEDNEAMRKSIELLGVTPAKTYRLYEKEL